MFSPANRHNNQQTPRNMCGFALVALLLGLALVLVLHSQEADASIGYFESYGWPTYGIVKPFWMTPFSAFPSRSISGYSRKHPMHNSRGLIHYDGY